MMDLGGNHIETGDAQKSQVNNVQGNGNVVLNVSCDLNSILEAVVKDQVAKYSAVALDSFQRRISDIGNQIIEKLKDESEAVLNKFQTPEIQYSLRMAALSYGRTNDKLTGEQLVDSFIDRLKSEEHSTMSSIIDEAIKTLPKMSLNSMTVLAMKLLEELHVIESWRYYGLLQKLGKMLKTFRSVSRLDVAHLIQIGCCSGHAQLEIAPTNMEENMAESYELFFIEDIAEETKNEIMGMIPPLQRGDSCINQVLSCAGDDTPLSKFYCFYPNTTVWKDQLVKQNLGHLCDKVDIIRSKIKTLLPQEIKSRLIQFNPDWQYCFDVMNEYQARNLQLTTVGVYLGSKMLKKELGLNVPISLFYPSRA